MSQSELPASIDSSAEWRLTFESAASHATRNVPIVEPGRDVGDVRQMLVGQSYDSASHIVVCRDDRFAGILTIEKVLAAPADAVIDSLMDQQAPVAAPGVDQEVAAWRAVRHGESALAVVDRSGRFVGVIPPHRLVAVLLAEHEEDLSRLGGFLRVTSTARTTSEEAVGRRLWHRIPWLLAGLAGALLTADVVGRFEDLLRVQVMLAFFIPTIVYLADAVGTQTEVVIVRGLSLNVPMKRMVSREMLAGLGIGLTLAVIAGPLVWWRWGDSSLAISIGLSVFAACSTATLAAMTLPWVFTRIGFDPAFGSGPLATVIQDLLSIYIYLVITSMVL
jgi:magnesium transporter